MYVFVLSIKHPCANLPHLGQVRIYEIGTDGQSRSKVVHHHQGSVLSVCWDKVSNVDAVRVIQIVFLQEENKVFSGGTDNVARMFDITTGHATQVAQHDAPIKVVKWVDAPQAGILATGSWDKTIKIGRAHV